MQNGRTYRYFKGKALFPFGHGLSYTTFDYSKVTLNKKKIKKNEPAEINFRLKNTGDNNGEEVVQLYVRNLLDPTGPLKSLRAFKRVSLKKGEETMMNITLPPSSFEFFNTESSKMEIRKGKYEILCGGTSDETLLQRATLTIY
jgi:beta-glucosidase